MSAIGSQGRVSAPWRSASLYALMLLAAVCAFLVIRRAGNGLLAAAPAGASAIGTTSLHLNTLIDVLIALVTITTTARLLGSLMARCGQPAVVGEILAGLALGPSLLGAVAPATAQWLLPTSVAPVLSALSQVGIILYMFLIGLEFDTQLLRNNSHASVAISHASIIVPFLAGAGLALKLYSPFATTRTPFVVFALFCGIATSITAFPVLARILRERGLVESPIGATALACAAVDDVTAWCLLAAVLGLLDAQPSRAATTLLLTALYALFMLLLVKPKLAQLLKRYPLANISQTVLALALVLLLASSLITEAIGIHAVFGAFLLGVIVPSNSELARGIRARIEDLVVVLLLPIFFAYTGTRVRIGLLHSLSEWLVCAAVVITACVGKFGGTALAARVVGLRWREATILGALMNARGLVELVVLNLGLDLGILSPTLFTMFVIMAVVTTAMTSPALAWIERSRLSRREAEKC